MIDCHMHIEQKEYQKNIDEFVSKWKKELKSIISSACAPKELEKALVLYKKFQPFLQISIGIHPTYIKRITEANIKKTIEFIKKNKENIVSIGEIGLDYYWIKEEEFREKQKELFRKMIRLAKELDLPIVVHSRDAREDTMDILKKEGAKKVLMHLFTDKKELPRVIQNNWSISIGPSIAKSKDIKKIARDMPLNRILLETDSPWFKQEGQKFGQPTNVIVPLKKIAEIKKISEEEVEKQTDLNAKKFFNLQ
ncbi:MAG: TatD family hydrolase [archaeon]